MKMKAVIYTKYGPPSVLEATKVSRPVPTDTQVLIEVHASSMNRSDCGYRSAQYFISRFFTGLITPNKQIGGSEFAGKIVEIGRNVTKFTVGDKVFGFDDINGSAHAEYMALEQSGPLALMPKQTDYQDMGVACEGATYALNDIEAVKLTKGSPVLVYGASGAIGSAAVQILKYQGMKETAVCGTQHVKLIKKLGADTVVDYQTQDFTDTTERYDFIFDAVGKSSFGICKKLLSDTGSYCSTELGNWLQNPLLALWFAAVRTRKVIFPIPKINAQKIQYIKEMIEAGAFHPVIDRSYSLDQAKEAAEYVETGQKTGNVSILVRK